MPPMIRLVVVKAACLVSKEVAVQGTVVLGCLKDIGIT